MSIPAPGSSPADTTLHSNVVFIIDATQKITGMQYVTNSLVISEGQPSKQPATIVETADQKDKFGIPYNEFAINLEAGRHATSTVADQFNSGTGGGDHEVGIGAWPDKSPADLNFFFSVTLNAGDSSCVLYIGQGSSLILNENNWWVGGSSIEPFDASWSIGSEFTFLGEGMYIVPAQGSTSNQFMLVPFPPKPGAFPPFF